MDKGNRNETAKYLMVTRPHNAPWSSRYWVTTNWSRFIHLLLFFSCCCGGFLFLLSSFFSSSFCSGQLRLNLKKFFGPNLPLWAKIFSTNLAQNFKGKGKNIKMQFYKKFRENYTQSKN